MFKNNYYLGMLLCGFSLCSFAAVPEKAVVKLKSNLCRASQKDRVGSGVLIQHENSFYVLSSDHVLHHEKTSQYCHQVSHHFLLQNKKLKLLSVNVFKGLSLLSLDLSKEEAESLRPIAFTLHEFAESRDYENSDLVQIFGFPLRADSLSEANGKIFNKKSSRHLFSMNSSSVEITGARSEFGMSGGLLWHNKSEKLLGLLSHQYLRSVTGAEAVLENNFERNPVQTSQIATLNVPATEIKKWLLSLFSQDGGAFTENSFKNVENFQRMPTKIFQLAKLEFELTRCSVPRGGDFSMLMARNGDGIDPGGIGGVVSLRDQKECELVIRLRKNYSSRSMNHYWPFKAQSEWYRKVLKALEKPKSKIIVKKFYDTQTGELMPLYDRFDYLFRHLSGGYSLLGKIESPFVDTDRLENALADSHSNITKIREELNLQFIAHISVVSLHEMLTELMEFLNPENIAYVYFPQEKLEAILESSAWSDLNQINDVDIFKVIDLQSELLRLQKYLEALRP